MENWKTNTWLTIAGIVCAGVINGLIFKWESATGNTLGLAITGFSIVYAAFIYPSLFTDKPKMKGNGQISFLHGFLGGIIFGLLWNHNLTRGVKGISHIVFICLIPGAIILVVIVLLALIGAGAFILS